MIPYSFLLKAYIFFLFLQILTIHLWNTYIPVIILVKNRVEQMLAEPQPPGRSLFSWQESPAWEIWGHFILAEGRIIGWWFTVRLKLYYRRHSEWEAWGFAFIRHEDWEPGAKLSTKAVSSAGESLQFNSGAARSVLINEGQSGKLAWTWQGSLPTKALSSHEASADLEKILSDFSKVEFCESLPKQRMGEPQEVFSSFVLIKCVQVSELLGVLLLLTENEYIIIKC